MNWRQKSLVFRRALLLTGSTLAALALVEGGVRAYRALAPDPSSPDAWEPGGPRPEPYRHARYFTAGFIDEAHAIEEGPDSFDGRYFNVVEGKRATTDTPAFAEGRVLLFGGSTMFSAEVPDSETIASHLQRLLNRQSPAYEVSNQGATAMTFVTATERLRNRDLGPRDIVVFYEGVNTVSRYVYSAESEEWLDDLIGRAIDRSRRFSAAARFAADFGTRRSPAPVRDAAQLSRNVDRMTSIYERTLAQASEYVRARGARFYNFLQPQLFSKKQWSAYELALLKDPGDVPVGMDVSLDRKSVV